MNRETTYTQPSCSRGFNLVPSHHLESESVYHLYQVLSTINSRYRQDPNKIPTRPKPPQDTNNTPTRYRQILKMSTNTPARNPFWLVPLLFVYTTLCQHPFPRVFADKCDRERQGTIQTIAGGTQDLAALVGLFATDSVERYSVDYSKGYLSVAVATSSLLGILGFVRALVKLGMGSKWCQDAAFPTGTFI